MLMNFLVFPVLLYYNWYLCSRAVCSLFFFLLGYVHMYVCVCVHIYRYRYGTPKTKQKFASFRVKRGVGRAALLQSGPAIPRALPHPSVWSMAAHCDVPILSS